jgi:hypothetical protein
MASLFCRTLKLPIGSRYARSEAAYRKLGKFPLLPKLALRVESANDRFVPVQGIALASVDSLELRLARIIRTSREHLEQLDSEKLLVTPGHGPALFFVN